MTEVTDLLQTALFADPALRAEASGKIRQLALDRGIFPASTHTLYLARGKGHVPSNFTVPAFNLRGLTFDMAKTIFQAAKQNSVGAFIFEIARSEMDYTKQPPAEFATSVLAAALESDWVGPVFLQADHAQFRTNPDGSLKTGELDSLQDLALSAIKSGFYNIDIDASTLVDLDEPTVRAQQERNIRYTTKLAHFIREHQPANTTVSIGGEIGHIGSVNSTPEDFQVFMDGFLERWNDNLPGLSKVSVATGTRHGGVVSQAGKLEGMQVDFSVLEDISKLARQNYGLAGAVQHGASTLPLDLLPRFPQTGTAEIHLATGLQNLIFDHPAFPQDLLNRIYSWLDKDLQSERKEAWSNEQFHYLLRKKAWGPFKQELFQIDESLKSQILLDLASRVSDYFTSLHVTYTHDLVSKYVTL